MQDELMLLGNLYTISRLVSTEKGNQGRIMNRQNLNEYIKNLVQDMNF